MKFRLNFTIFLYGRASWKSALVLKAFLLVKYIKYEAVADDRLLSTLH